MLGIGSIKEGGVRVLWMRKVRGRRLGRSVECRSRGSMVVWFCFVTGDI